MSIQILRKADLTDTARHVQNATYDTVRFLLAEDGTDVTVTDIVLTPDVDAVYGYDHHTEIAYCIAGEAALTDAATGHTQHITPGTMWIARPGSRFHFRAHTPTWLICMFTPPFTGRETGFAGDQ